MGNLIDTNGLDQYTDEITTFTSGDSSSPSSFTTIPVVASKEKPSSLFQKLSQAISNIRFLRGQINVTTNAATPVAASANANNSVAIGYGSNANVNRSIAIGYGAIVKAGGAYEDAGITIGCQANANASGVAIGCISNAYKNSVAVGVRANAVANNTVAIGTLSEATKEGATAIGYYVFATGDKSICIGGSDSGYENWAKGTYSIAIGCAAHANANFSTVLGFGAKATTTNTIQLGNDSVSSLKCKVQLTVTSDVRDKTDIVSIPNAIDFLNEIEPITYVSNMRSLYEYDYKEEVQNEDGSTEIIDNNPYKEYGFTPYDKEEHAKGTKKGERRRSGVSAQNVREAMIKIYGTDNYANLINDDMYDRENVPEEVESHLGVQYECFVPFLIKAVQELDARVKELEGRS